MSATIGVASVSVAISARANAIAQEAQKTACIDMVQNYKGSVLVENQKQYAKCVGILHPKPISAEEMIGAKILIASIFIGIFIGIILAARDSYLNGEKWVFFPLGCGVILPMTFGLLWLLCSAAMFLFGY
jgi:hypothetical protein